MRALQMNPAFAFYWVQRPTNDSFNDQFPTTNVLLCIGYLFVSPSPKPPSNRIFKCVYSGYQNWTDGSALVWVVAGSSIDAIDFAASMVYWEKLL